MGEVAPPRSAFGAPPQGGDAGGPAEPDPRRPLEGAREASPLGAFWAAFRENRGALAGFVVVLFIVLMAIGADFIAPHSPTEQFREAVRAVPMWAEGGSARFVLGTDSLGRDMLSRLIHGARISLFIGLAVMGVSFVIGVALGLACVALGSAVDVMVTRAMDLIMAVPSLVLAILVVAVLGPSLTNTIVAVSIVTLPRYVRLVRASALAELGKDYVVSARVAGVGRLRLMLSTVLPNCLSPLIVQAALGVSDAILEAAALGFLGLGAQPPTAEWGTMLADAREFIRSNPWLVTLPGLAILVTVVSINLMGDGLRDALDPKMRRS
jgi:dipeptide transport system permease protein